VATILEIEERIFELTGREAVGQRIVNAVIEEYGIDSRTAWALHVKVRRERGSPNMVALKEKIDRLGRLSFLR
jgi:hypothetical protein